MLTDRFQPTIYFEESNDNGGESSHDGDESNNGKKSPEDIMPDADADALRNALREKRDSEAKYRKERNNYKDQLSELQQFKSKVESIFGDEEDPEQKVSSLEGERDKLQTELSILKAANKYGGDAELVTAHLMYNGNLDGDVDEAVKSAIENNPKLKADQPKTVGDGESDEGDEQAGSMNDWIRKAAGR